LRLSRKKLCSGWKSDKKTPILFLEMLSLPKSVDYALLSLAYLVGHKGRISSARAIALSHELPLPVLMNVLKKMHQKGILCSSRGAKGGYQICTSLDKVSLYDLIEAVEEDEDRTSPVVRRLSNQPPLRALQYKLMHFLKQIRLSDLVIPGQRIDVPVELITARKCTCHEHVRNEPKLPETLLTI
jgi:Rrf2 family protein